MWKYLFILIVIHCSLESFAQVSIFDIEEKIQGLEQEIKQTNNDALRLELSKKMENAFSMAILDDAFMNYTFHFKYISCLESDDKKLKVISWDIPLQNQTNVNFGFFIYQQNKRKRRTYNFTRLQEAMQSPEMMASRTSGWKPVLYYQLIEKQSGRKTYYTLLGWDGKDAISNKKVVDILRFSGNGRILFGDKIITGKGKKMGHLEFEYNARSVMQLKYINGALVFDHLSPIEPQYKGISAYYGPDGTYDGLIFENGKWKLVEGIDIRNPKTKKTKKKNKHSY